MHICKGAPIVHEAHKPPPSARHARPVALRPLERVDGRVRAEGVHLVWRLLVVSQVCDARVPQLQADDVDDVLNMLPVDEHRPSVLSDTERAPERRRLVLAHVVDERAARLADARHPLARVGLEVGLVRERDVCAEPGAHLVRLLELQREPAGVRDRLALIFLVVKIVPVAKSRDGYDRLCKCGDNVEQSGLAQEAVDPA